MSKFVIRHNFETNSSSMHSLAIRREEGWFSDEELHSESLVGSINHDAIVMMREGKSLTTDEIRKQCWIYNDRMRIWSNDFNLANSAMQILDSFRDKLTYALATVCGYRYNGWEKRRQEIYDVFNKYLPGVKLDADITNDDYMGRTASTNEYLLYPFLKKHKITIEEFLVSTKYLVIIDYAEYQKMKWLDMVTEENVQEVFKSDRADEFHMHINNGVWELNSCDINFGRYPFRVLGTPEGKARYALATYRSSNIDEVLKIMQEVYPEIKSIKLPKDRWSEDGIDCGYNEDPVIPDGISMRDFILDKKYVVIVDGDEYCIWSGFKNSPLFNRKAYPDERIGDDY